MKTRNLMMSLSALAVTAGSAFANTSAFAVTDLNLRAGPGPKFEVVDVIEQKDKADVLGCLEDSKWCKVSYNGQQGWAYGEYLTAGLDQSSMTPVVAEEMKVTVGEVIYEVDEKKQDEATLGVGAFGATAGALLAGPVGAVAGGLIGAATAAAISIEPKVVTYVQTQTVEPVYLDGEVVVGARIPEGVELYAIPDSDLRYANINNVSVLIDPEDRSITHIMK